MYQYVSVCIVLVCVICEENEKTNQFFTFGLVVSRPKCKFWNSKNGNKL